jgi:transglutaminase-like putative cysteine protease
MAAGKISTVSSIKEFLVKLRALSLLLPFLACQVAAQTTSKAQKFSPPARTFRFTYNFTVKDIPSGAKRVRVWIPLPQTDQHQTVRILTVKAPVRTRMTQEAGYGNRMMYAEIQNSAAGQAEFTLEYRITRREYSRGDYAHLEQTDQKPSVVSASMSRLIAPDSLIPTDGKIRQLAFDVTGSQSGAVAKAKAAYDYLFTNMRYDKTGSGWGRGDAVWACDAKRGNCTDFHSPFIGMLRADGIPARFDIGFPLPENKEKGDIAGYHCWAEFYSSKIGWIPVDISEAW